MTSEAVLSMEKAPLPDQKTCPAPTVIGMIGGKWKLLILQILIFQGTKRFGELRRSIDGITQTMLTNQLRALEADGLVVRKVYAEVPPRVEYSASADGKALEPVFTAMHDWWTHRSHLS
ncbi:MAG: helix-turn-helix domain-containing protein [Pseudomonadota bacterium]